MLVVILILLVLVFGFTGPYVYSGSDPRYGSGGLGFVLVVLLILYLLRPGLFHGL